jgi:hypothetical protein
LYTRHLLTIWLVSLMLCFIVAWYECYTFSIFTVGRHWEISLNLDLNITNERQDCYIGTVCRKYFWEREGEWNRLRWGYMVDEFYILLWTRTKKSLPIVLSETGRGSSRRDSEGNLTIGQCKCIWNCHTIYPDKESEHYILCIKINIYVY